MQHWIQLALFIVGLIIVIVGLGKLDDVGDYDLATPLIAGMTALFGFIVVVIAILWFVIGGILGF